MTPDLTRSVSILARRTAENLTRPIPLDIPGGFVRFDPLATTEERERCATLYLRGMEVGAKRLIEGEKDE